MIDSELKFNGIPAIYITCAGGMIALTKTAKTRGSIVISNAAGSTFPEGQLFSGSVDMKRRGNGTAVYPKTSANITLLGTDLKKKLVTLFGMPAESDFSLLAEAQDKTHFRTIFTNRLSYVLGLPWASCSQKVEVFERSTDADTYTYAGLFTLCEKVKKGANRIAIYAISKTNNTAPEATGGYVIEKQPFDQLDVAEGRFQTSSGDWMGFKEPDGGDITSAQIAWIAASYEDLLSRLAQDPADLVNGYRAVVDVDSFAQFFLLQDISKNADIASWHFTKQRNGNWFGGPGWDWNSAWAYVRIASATATAVNFTNPFDSYTAVKSFVYSKLMADPFFANRVKEIYYSKLTPIHKLYAELLDFCKNPEWLSAVERDRVRWPEHLTPELLIPLATYELEIARVFTFIVGRLYFQTTQIYDYVAPRPVSYTA